MVPKVKTILTTYLVKINSEIVDKFATLRDARQHIRSMPINDDVNVVQIIKQTLNETLLDTYETQTTKILKATHLDEGM